jgi:hypothetical protein
MRQYHHLFIASLLLLLSGCASQTQLTNKVSLTANDVHLIDNRSQLQKERKKDAVFSAVVMYEDEKFSPRALDIFQSNLVTGTKLVKPVRLEVDEFRVGDFYPVRLGAGGQGFLGAALFETLIDKNTNWAFVDTLKLSRDSDSLFCIVIGKINGKPFKVAIAEKYKTSPFAGLIVNDPDYRRALDLLIKKSAVAAIEQSNNP